MLNDDGVSTDRMLVSVGCKVGGTVDTKLILLSGACTCSISGDSGRGVGANDGAVDGAEGSGLMWAMPWTKGGEAREGSVWNSAISSSVNGSNREGVSTLGLWVVRIGLGSSEMLLAERLLTEWTEGLLIEGIEGLLIEEMEGLLTERLLIEGLDAERLLTELLTEGGRGTSDGRKSDSRSDNMDGVSGSGAWMSIMGDGIPRRLSPSSPRTPIDDNLGVLAALLLQPVAVSYSVSAFLVGGRPSDTLLYDSSEWMLGMEERLPNDSKDRILATSESFIEVLMYSFSERISETMDMLSAGRE
jgi:hypothetical protein